MPLLRHERTCLGAHASFCTRASTLGLTRKGNWTVGQCGTPSTRTTHISRWSDLVGVSSQHRSAPLLPAGGFWAAICLPYALTTKEPSRQRCCLLTLPRIRRPAPLAPFVSVLLQGVGPSSILRDFVPTGMHAWLPWFSLCWCCFVEIGLARRFCRHRFTSQNDLECFVD